MIRASEKNDTGRIAEIWLDTNIKAHGFIPAEYWQGNFDAVKEMLSQAELYVYEDREIQGFIGLDGSYVAGIFVCRDAQSRGSGKQLLDYAKGLKGRLVLNVYQKNTRAVQFYQREGFLIQQEGFDGNTGEKEYSMQWDADAGNAPRSMAETDGGV